MEFDVSALQTIMISDKQVRVFLIDDDEDDLFLVKELLKEFRQRYILEWASGFEEAKSKIEKSKYDVYLLDFRLGAYTGLDVLEYIKMIDGDAPVIMLTGIGNETIDRDAMNLGAADYLIKSKLDSQVLDRTIRYALERSNNLLTLKEQEEKYRKLFELSRDMMFFIDSNGVITEANSSASRELGSSEELKGKSIETVLGSEAGTFITETIQSGKDFRGKEILLKSRDEEEIECLFSCWTHDSQNNIIICVVSDISQQKRSERQQQAIDKLDSNNRIARIIAHEVRNPLTNISLAVENILQENVGDEFRPLLGIISRNATRINQLISELLYSTSFAVPNFSDFEIQGVIEETLQLAQDRLDLKNVKVETRFAENSCRVKVDREKIKIALLNLIINAVEAMDERDGKLYISTEQKGSRCLITIRDNGPGIPDEYLPRLFEPFFSRKKTGTGLGLTTTQNIILSHKGTISVKSTLGEGTSFVVALEMDPVLN